MDFGSCLLFLALDVESGDQFAGRIDAFGALGPTSLADLGASPGLFHALCLCHVRRFATIRHIGHSAIVPGSTFTTPGQDHLASAGIALEYQAMFSYKFVGSHNYPITNDKGWLPSTYSLRSSMQRSIMA